jgi:hypothetical protein
MSVCDGPGRAGTPIGLLTTQRSRVQIPPPLPGQRPLPIKEGAFCVPHANGTGVHAAAPSSPPGSPAVSTTAPVTSVVTSGPPMISVGSILPAIFRASGNTTKSAERLIDGPIRADWDLPDVAAAIDEWLRSDGYFAALPNLGDILHDSSDTEP